VIEQQKPVSDRHLHPPDRYDLCPKQKRHYRLTWN